MSDYNDFNKKIIQEFRSNNGVVGGPFEGMTLLLVNTIGAKSGQNRTNPVAYIKDNGRYVIAASKGGADSHPDWYYNLSANPAIEIEVGDQKLAVKADFPEEPQRTELYNKLASQYPGFRKYQDMTSRVIPVITLTPSS